MARFYFHVANGQTTLDEVGTDLAGLHAVRQEALGITRELMFGGGGQRSGPASPAASG